MPDEPLHCYRHPNEETYLRCSTCNRPICTRCMVYAPVGVKCKECASLRSTHLYQIAPGRLALAILAALIASALGSWLLRFGLLALIWVALPLGYGIGGLVLKIAGQKRGIIVEIAAGASVLLGALGGQVAFAAWRLLTAPAPILSPGSSASLWSAFTVILDPFFLIATAITTFAAVSKIRFW